MSENQTKVLFCGDVKGNFGQLLRRLNSVVRKHGQFDMLFCVGEFFGPDDEINQKIVSGRLYFPIATYILGPCSRSTSAFYPDKRTEFPSNVTYLGRKGLLNTASGLQIAYLSGIEGSTSNPFQFTWDDVQELLVPIRTQAGFLGVDILITSMWPHGVARFGQPTDHDIEGSQLIARIAYELKPRYHFAGMEPHYERQPFRNCMVNGNRGQIITRFVGLNHIVAGRTPKWIYELLIKPMNSRNLRELSIQPINTTSCPYFINDKFLKMDILKLVFKKMEILFLFCQDNSTAFPDPEMIISLKQLGIKLDNYIRFEGRVTIRRARLATLRNNLMNLFEDCVRILMEKILFLSEEAERLTNRIEFYCLLKPWERIPFVETISTLLDQLNVFNDKYVPISLPQAKKRFHSSRDSVHGYLFLKKLIDTASESIEFADHKMTEDIIRIFKAGGEISDLLDGKIPCMSCFTNTSLSKHLVVSVGDLCYAAMPKGPLVGDHVMVLTIGHIQSLVAAPEDVRNEVTKYKDAFTLVADKNGKALVCFEENFESQHLQIQMVPVPKNSVKGLKAAFQKAAALAGFELIEIDAKTKLTELVNEECPYFFAELPDGSRLFTKQMKSFPLQFGREVLASRQILDCEDKIDWRAAALGKEQETELTKQLQAKFKPFDFTEEGDSD